LPQRTAKPAPEIVDALDEAFYLSFENVEPTPANTTPNV